ncbi:MAG: hypothetical protein V4660_15675 [Pseudomonadota bacterium]
MNSHFFKRCVALSLLLISVVLLNACVTHAPKEAQWPTDIPSRSFFVAAYEADLDNKEIQDRDEYLLWVFRFYKGWELYRNGWSQVISDSLIGVTDPVVAQEIKTKMEFIGSTIATEWAKTKKDRRILTRHVVVWGNALIESIKRGERVTLINKVLSDVTGLLSGAIDLDDVKAERYYPKDKDDVFG